MPLSRRNFRIALLAFVAASLVVIFLALEHAISHRRWPVKTLADADRARVVRDPVDTTVALPVLSAPRAGAAAARPKDSAARIHGLRVRAKLVAVHKMLDGDFHVLIADPDAPSARMIVEKPVSPRRTFERGSRFAGPARRAG